MSLVLHIVHLVPNELSHANILSPSIPNLRDELFIWMLSHSHPRNILIQEHLIFAKPLSALKLDLLLSVMLLSHEIFEVVNFFHGSPVSSSLRSTLSHFLLKLLSIMLILPNLECISDSL